MKQNEQNLHVIWSPSFRRCIGLEKCIIFMLQIALNLISKAYTAHVWHQRLCSWVKAAKKSCNIYMIAWNWKENRQSIRHVLVWKHFHFGLILKKIVIKHVTTYFLKKKNLIFILYFSWLIGYSTNICKYVIFCKIYQHLQ